MSALATPGALHGILGTHVRVGRYTGRCVGVSTQIYHCRDHERLHCTLSLRADGAPRQRHVRGWLDALHIERVPAPSSARSDSA